MAVSFGVVGSGDVARMFASAIPHMHDVEMRAVTHGSRAEAFAKEFGIAYERSYEDLLARSDIDAVIIGLPDHLHREFVVRAANARKHVFVEKPMAPTTADCDEMIRACRSDSVLLSVSKILRYLPPTRVAKGLIEAGEIGRIQMIRVVSALRTAEANWDVKPWHKRIDAASPWMDSASHTNDILRWITKSEATLVFAKYANYTQTPPLAQSGAAVIVFGNGVIADSWLTYELPDPGLPERRYNFFEIVGSAGIIELDTYGRVLLGKGSGWKTVHEQMMQSRWLDPLRFPAFAAMYQDFADAIREQREPSVTGEDGRAAVEIGEAADLANAMGQAVPLPLGIRAPAPIWATWVPPAPRPGGKNEVPEATLRIG